MKARLQAKAVAYLREILGVEAAFAPFPARPDGDLTPERCRRIIEERAAAIPSLRPAFDLLAEQRSQHLVEAHERFSSLVEKKRFGVVYPVLPMDVLGLYILMPASSQP